MLVRRKRSESGSAIVELALMSPWIFFLFVGVFTFGFFMYAGICVQNAASIAAAQTSSGPGSATPGIACQAALAEMKLLPNSSNFAAPSGNNPGCNAGSSVPTNIPQTNPLWVNQATLCGSTTAPNVIPICGGNSSNGATVANTRPTSPTCADCGQDTTAASSQVSVTYRTVPLIPIPGVMAGQITLTRVAETRIVVQ